MKYLFSILFVMLIAPLSAGAMTTTSSTIDVRASGGSNIGTIVVSNFASGASSRTYQNNDPIRWDICRGRATCGYGNYTVYITYYDTAGVEEFSTTKSVTYKEPVTVVRDPVPAPTQPVVTQPVLPETFDIPVTPVVPTTPEPSAVELPNQFGNAFSAILTAQRTQDILQTTAVASGAAQVVATTIATVAPSLSTSSLILLPARLWNLLLVLLGLRKRMRPWGVVFDSLTKQPLDPVIVVLKDVNGNEVSSGITDIDGRYGFYVEPGMYQIEVGKSNYQFPSSILIGQKYDTVYENLYHGELLSLSNEAVIAKNIPMDALAVDWNQVEKKRINKGYTTPFMQFIAKATNGLFYAGLISSIVSLVASFHILNLVFLGLYVILFLARRAGFKPRVYGRITIGTNPAAHAVLRIWSSVTGVQIGKAVTDDDGNYYVLVPKGTYTASVEIPDGTGNLRPYISGMQVVAEKGIINSPIALPVM